MSTRETRLEFLTWIATFATVAGVVVAALPLLARTAFSPSSLSARTSAAGLAIVGLGLFLTRMVRRMGQPDLLLIEATKLLTIHDKAGRNAGMLRRHTYLATRDVASWVFALSMRADGRIADLCINGDPVNPSEIDVVLGSTHLQRVFLEPLKKGHRVTAELTYTLHDSFVGPRQRSIMGVSMSPQRIAIGIQLPADRPSIDAVGFLAYHDQPEEELSGVVVADNGHSIHFECDHPRRGAQYQVVWRW